MEDDLKEQTLISAMNAMVVSILVLMEDDLKARHPPAQCMRDGSFNPCFNGR